MKVEVIAGPRDCDAAPTGVSKSSIVRRNAGAAGATRGRTQQSSDFDARPGCANASGLSETSLPGENRIAEPAARCRAARGRSWGVPRATV